MFRFSEFLFCDFAWIRGIKYSKLKIPLSMTEYAIALFYKTSNNSSILSCLLTFILIQTISIRNKYFNQFSSVYMLWFNFILGSNFLFFCFWVLKCMIMSLKQRKIEFELRIKLNHNIYIQLSNINKKEIFGNYFIISFSVWMVLNYIDGIFLIFKFTSKYTDIFHCEKLNDCSSLWRTLNQMLLNLLAVLILFCFQKCT